MKIKQQYFLISTEDNTNIGVISIGPQTEKNIIKGIVEIEEKLKSALRQHFDNDNIDISEVLNAEEINALFEYGKRMMVEVEVAIGGADKQDEFTEKAYIEKTWLFE